MPADPGNTTTVLAGVLAGLDSQENPLASANDVAGRDVLTSSIAQLVPQYAGPFVGRLSHLDAEKASSQRQAGFATGWADHVALDQLPSEASAEASRQEPLAGASVDRGQNQQIRTRRFGSLENASEMLTVNDRLSDAALGDIVEMTGLRDWRANPGHLDLALAHDTRWNTEDGLASQTTTRTGEPEARAAADEVERLRTAVKETIDELDRIRGSVHPPLPALPLNRGTFRIS